ncbi:glycosyltransferase [Crassaminicella profunda]|uniref:glycosyltransferase n=1 Tax=Crassaminicella profunda TaxID=1286698 RepID=UPI001CA6FEE4|nr:glycosyltransferase [Crassaminicella profunda]QZY56324.1 glycosyltransferase [Crassaminicella profunda]
MKTSIILLTFNQLHYTKLCINSIRKYTDKNTYELIVIDNHSTDGTTKWLKNQEDIQCIFNEDNLGFPKGCNQGIKIAKGDNILLLNNDIIVTPNWLTNLNKCLYSDKDIGAVGAVTNNCSNHQTIPSTYNNIEEMITFAKKNNISSKNQWEEKLRLIGFCMLIKKEVVEKIGLLDERFSPGNFEDDDYSFRIKLAGYKLMLCKDVFIHHFGSVSFNETKNEFSKILKVNKKKFKKKWGFSISYYSNIQVDLINLMDNFQSKKVNVLEIGCGYGGTLLQIKNNCKTANLYGIDLNKKALEIAKSFANVQCLNIENEKLPYDENYFDYIILGNILEHLYDPWKILKNIGMYMKKDGKILASIPNIMHYSNIKNLINGNWVHDDQTPIRFFTLKQINTMFNDVNYTIETITGKTTQPNEADKKLINSLNNITGRNMTKQYQFQQYFIKARKIENSIEENNSNHTKIKFLLRRIENDILIEESSKSLIEIIDDSKLNLNTLIKIIHMNIIKKDKVLNQLSSQLSKKNMYEYANILLSKSYEINPQNIETQELLKIIEGENLC